MALASYADQEYYEKVSGVIITDDHERRQVYRKPTH